MCRCDVGRLTWAENHSPLGIYGLADLYVEISPIHGSCLGIKSIGQDLLAEISQQIFQFTRLRKTLCCNLKYTTLPPPTPNSSNKWFIMNYYLFPIGYSASSGSRSRQGSGKIVNLINSQQTYGLGREEGRILQLFPLARLPSCLAWGVWFQSACQAQSHTDTYCNSFISHCPLKCQILLQSSWLAETQVAWLSLRNRTPNLPSTSKTRGLTSCCYLHLIYNSSTNQVRSVLREYLFPRTKSSFARCQ